MKYLMVVCEELGDQYECDANRTPEAITDDWEKYCEEHSQNYYDVWEIREDNSLYLIREYTDTPSDCGMAYVIVEGDYEYPTTIVKKYPNLTEKDRIPKEVYEAISKLDDVMDNLADGGSYCGVDKDWNWHYYCYYENGYYHMW